MCDLFFLVLQSQTPRSLEAALPCEPSIPFCTVSSWPSSFWSGLLGLHPLIWDLYAANLHFLPSQFVCNTRLPCIISGKRPWVNAAEFFFYGHPTTSPQTTSSLVQSAAIAVKEAQIEFLTGNPITPHWSSRKTSLKKTFLNQLALLRL